MQQSVKTLLASSQTCSGNELPAHPHLQKRSVIKMALALRNHKGKQPPMGNHCCYSTQNKINPVQIQIIKMIKTLNLSKTTILRNHSIQKWIKTKFETGKLLVARLRCLLFSPPTGMTVAQCSSRFPSASAAVCCQGNRGWPMTLSLCGLLLQFIYTGLLWKCSHISRRKDVCVYAKSWRRQLQSAIKSQALTYPWSLCHVQFSVWVIRTTMRLLRGGSAACSLTCPAYLTVKKLHHAPASCFIQRSFHGAADSHNTSVKVFMQCRYSLTSIWLQQPKSHLGFFKSSP